MDDGQQYCLRWNNYQSNMTSVFHQLLQNEAFVDVTLACNNLSLKAHKVVLSACSSYFQKLLLENPCKHPTIIMPQDVGYADLKFIIEFVYKGEIDVSQAELQSLLRTADQLKIKGLCESPDDKEYSELPLAALSTKGDKNSPTSTQFKLQDNNPSVNNKRPASRQETPSATNEAEPEDKEDDTEDQSTENEENDMPVALDERKRKRPNPPEQTKPLNMSSHGLLSGQFGVDTDDFPPEPPAPSAIPVGHMDMSNVEHSPTRTLLTTPIHRIDISDSTKYTLDIKKEADIKFETLRSYDQDSLLDMESHMSGPDHSMDSHEDGDRSMHQGVMGQGDFGGMLAGVSNRLDVNSSEDQVPGIKTNGHSENTQRSHTGGGPKTWTQEDMDMALDALRNHNMSLTKASATYGIPSTTLWQRAHRLGIDTPKKEGPTKSWTEENLNNALEALRTGTISANKASKAYGIPSSTLYKIARREGIRLAAPFNAAPTTWTPEDLEKALESIRTGQTSVQKASTEFGIPTGTLYGRCKREGIELSRSNPTPWSEDAMGEALEAVRLGHMSINQAAIHYNLPYSSLYGRFKRGIKYDPDNVDLNQDSQLQMDHSFGMEYATSPSQIQYQNQNS
ncbi:uncharacterized protein isoform X2 [Leptinotarsa decemlineata]|uniref:uncharacterized protein isoform X2 n=1 Tax=Leptinotarsa decemlineata TaxID=7539 RepID=UPI000C255621|nr:protein bric-a-brac 1-like isoform X2 [Leptinotarsa decemlineata]